jgi:hypothetical protein
LYLYSSTVVHSSDCSREISCPQQTEKPFYGGIRYYTNIVHVLFLTYRMFDAHIILSELSYNALPR